LVLKKSQAAQNRGVLGRRATTPAKNAHERAANACEGPMAVYTARIGWEHAKQMAPVFHPYVAFGEQLVPHFIHRVDL
jgi:hypothetical protein